MLQKLHKHKVGIEILLSNHDAEFIEAYEDFEKTKDMNGLFIPRYIPMYAPSMFSLSSLIEEGLVSVKEVMQLAHEVYKPTLKAISYSLLPSEEDESKYEITIYSHAGIGLETIKELARQLKIKYADNTAKELAQTIDNINQRFQDYVQGNKLLTLIENNAFLSEYYEALKQNPLAFIMWNRRYDELERSAEHKDYKIKFVHGHDPYDHDVRKESHLYNLDNMLGKLLDRNEGEYTVFCSKPVSSALLSLSASSSEEVLSDNDESEDFSSEEETDELIATKNGDSSLEPKNIFEKRLIEIKRKEIDLRARGEAKAANTIKELHDTLKQHYDALNDGTMKENEFQSECLTAIETSRPVLEEFRGWKTKLWLGNIGVAVAMLGVGYVIAGGINMAVTGRFTFFKTSSANKLNKFKKDIQNNKALSPIR